MKYSVESTQLYDTIRVNSKRTDLVQLSRRSIDARRRAIIIGGTIGSTASAVILAIGIYLLFHARRKQRTVGTLPRTESQPIEIQPPELSASNNNRITRSIPSARAPVHGSVPPSSWGSKVVPAPTSSGIQLAPLCPRDLGYAGHARASTGSQFLEHFEDVQDDQGDSQIPEETPVAVAGPSRIPISPRAQDSQHSGDPTSPIQAGASATHSSPVSAETSGTGQPPFQQRRDDSPKTSDAGTRSSSGAMTPVGSIEDHSPPATSMVQNDRAQLSQDGT